MTDSNVGAEENVASSGAHVEGTSTCEIEEAVGPEVSDGGSSTLGEAVTPHTIINYLEIEDEEDELFKQTPSPPRRKGDGARVIEADLGFDDDEDNPASMRPRKSRGGSDLISRVASTDNPATSDCNLYNSDMPVDNLTLEETEMHPLDGLSMPSWIGDYQQQWNENVFANNQQDSNPSIPLNPDASYSRLLGKETASDSDCESFDTQTSLESGLSTTWKVGDTLGEPEEEPALPSNISQPKPPNPSSGIWNRLFRAKDPNRTKFEKYAHDLRSCIDEMEQGINDCQSQIKAIKKEMRKETKKWRRYAQVTMENMARTYFENRLLHVNSKIHVFAKRLEVLNQRLNQVQQVLDGKDMKSFNIQWFDEDGNFLHPTALPLPEDAQTLTESCETMETVVADLRQQYTELKKQSTQKKSREQRHNFFTKEIDIAFQHKQIARGTDADNKFHWHPSHIEGTQLNFNCLVLDQRYSPGVLLHRWYSKIEKQDKVEPQLITGFIDYLSKYLIGHYNLDSKYYQTIILFLERLIFPRIVASDKKPLFRSQMTDAEKKQDEVFREKAAWLRTLSQDKLGINPKFCKKDIDESNLEKYDRADLPFGPCIEALVGEARVQVPTDILYSILQAILKINVCAQSYCSNKDEMIGADDLFPMVVYVVVHSKVPDINARLGFLERYLKFEHAHRGEAAMCRSLLQAAVAYITSCDKTDFE